VSCILGQDKDGNRFIACTRGRRLSLNNKDPSPIVRGSPWQIGVKVLHKSYGEGIIVHRGAEWMEIEFPVQGVKRFMIELIGQNIQVVQ
jgi:hypothetical protein